jgi:WD40 repeat protein
MLATAGAADDQKHLWRTEDGALIRNLASARGGLGAIVFSPDGTLVAAGNGWHEVRWWRVADGALLRSVKGHRDSVNSVAFSPDGEVLASGSLDGEVKLWGMALTTSSGMPHETDPLDGTHWSLVSLQGQRPIEGTRVTLHFADGFVQGSAGCNDYRPLIIDSDDETYQYQITRDDQPKEGAAESGALSIPNFIITEKDCPSPEGIMQQERIYVEALRDAAAYQISDERLEIDNAQGETILVFTQEDK